MILGGTAGLAWLALCATGAAADSTPTPTPTPVLSATGASPLTSQSAGISAAPPALPAAEIPADCDVSGEALSGLQEGATGRDTDFFGAALYLPVLDAEILPAGDGHHAGSAPPAGSAPGGTAPEAPEGKERPGPWPNGTGLPAPNALPAAPGSGSANTLTSGGPGSAAAWLPSQYLVIPTSGSEPIRGPLQHVHSAVAADPGSSPD
ncbi:hypothetical protein AR539_07010 [Arthrobacter sp. EPSL27]|nr:hypothetical protein AR539_07010 [Arthrobacter sp. EPSL27]